MRRIFVALLVIAAAAFGLASPARAEKRVALVIGNSAYRTVSPLKNPANDSADVSAALKAVGFEVIDGRDLTRDGMRATIRKFGQTLRGADVGLLFYAGHGMQVAGENYLVPVDAAIEEEGDLVFEAINLDIVLGPMEREAKTALVFLDACRDNPMAQTIARSMGARSVAVGRGLARIDTSGVGTFIAFATQPGNVALDGDGRNSPFSSALLKHIAEPGQSLSDLMITVRNEVRASTGGRQTPWENSSLTGQFYFAARPIAEAKPDSPPPAADDLKSIMAQLQELKQQLAARETEKKLQAGEPAAPVVAEAEAPARSTPAVPEAEQKLAALPPVIPPPVSTPPAEASSEAQRACNRLIREPAERVVYRGVIENMETFKEKAAEAVSACDAAVRERPGQGFELPLGIAYALSDTPERANDIFFKLAEQGDVRAAAALAFLMIDRAEAGDLDREKAGRLLLEAAYQGSPEAMLLLGAALLNGKGLPKNEAEGMRWAVKSADAGFGWAMTVLGSEPGIRDHFADPVGWLKKAAESGHAAGMAALADAFEQGKGVPVDFAEAQKLLRKALVSGFVPAKEKLSSLEAAHPELSPTTEADIRAVLVALPGGMVAAPSPAAQPVDAAKDCDRLVKAPIERVIYAGVPETPEALKSGMPLGAIACELAAEVEPNERRFAFQRALAYALLGDSAKARPLFEALANQGDALAMTALGATLSAGFAPDARPEDSVAWLKKAADLGSPEAMILLGVAYSKGGGVAADQTEATRWVTKAADAGFSWAMVILGNDAENVGDRIGWLRKSAEAGNAQGMFELAAKLAKGDGVEQNEAEAKDWLREADALGHPGAKADLARLEEPTRALSGPETGASASPSIAPPAAPALSVKIAVVGPITGAMANFGLEVKNGAELAVEEINAAGGVLGRHVELQIADDACDPENAANRAAILAHDGVVLVVGHVCSAASIAASEAYARKGVIQITPASTNPKLTDQRAGRNVYRLATRDDRQGAAAIAFLGQKYKRVGILSDGATYGGDLASSAQNALKAAGKKEALFEYFVPGDKDYAKLVGKLKRAKVDAVFAGGLHQDLAAIAREMRRQKFPAVLMGGDALMTSEFSSAAGSAAEGVLLVGASDPRKAPEAAALVERFKARGIDPEGYTINAHTAVMTWKAAVEKADSLDAAEVEKALDTSEFETALGKLRFDGKGDQTLPLYAIYRWSNGAYAQLE